MDALDIVEIRVDALIKLRKEQLAFDSEWEWYVNIMDVYMWELKDEAHDGWYEALTAAMQDVADQTSPTYRLMVKTGIMANVEQMAYNDIFDVVRCTKKRFN
jgi:hypothetical protein